MKRDASKSSSGLTLLGRSVGEWPESPDQARLECFPSPAKRDYTICFETGEFTSLCPVTGQPDFAKIGIEYMPARLCVESKSLKLYLASFRNVRAFNEAVINRILDDFVRACAPRFARVTGEFASRGGVAIRVVAEHRAKGFRPACS